MRLPLFTHSRTGYAVGEGVQSLVCMKTQILALSVFAAVSAFAETNFSIGINIGTPPPPPRLMYVHPPSPGPGYTWIDGYWGADGPRYVWYEGYWSQPPYAGAFWVTPRYEKGKWYKGYWDGKPGRAMGHQRGRGKGHSRHDD